MATHYAAMKALRTLGKQLHANDELWNRKVSLSAGVWHDLQAWTDDVLRNAPTSIPPRVDNEDVTIFCEASKWGWGAVALDHAIGSVRFHSAPWPASFTSARHSVRAEPRAILEAARRIVPQHSKRRFRFFTDSVTAKAVYKAGYSADFETNSVVATLRREFQQVHFEFNFIAGKLNTAADAMRSANEQ